MKQDYYTENKDVLKEKVKCTVLKMKIFLKKRKV